ncbi:MAG: hypothetical protein ACI4AK_07270 [Lepagella sp.]
MKHFGFVVLAVVALMLCSCNEDEAPVEKKSMWDKYLGKHLTWESDEFEWARYDKYGWPLSPERIARGEYVEFYDLTEDGITIKTGSDKETKYYNLANATNGKIKKRLLCPYSPYYFCKDVVMRLKFRKDNKYSSFTQFSGKSEIGSEMIISIDGQYFTKLTITREIEYKQPCLDTYGTGFSAADWTCYPYLFDTKSLTCKSSPIVTDWSTTAWDGDIASIIPDPNNFLQLLLAIPIHKVSFYGFTGSESEYISTERLFKALLSKFTSGDGKYTFMYTTPQKQCIDYTKDSHRIFGDNNGNIKIGVDASKLFSDPLVKNDGSSHLFANLLNSVIEEDQCSFDTDYYENKEVNELGSTVCVLTIKVKDPQSSRKLMEDVLFSTWIRNKERIKEYIRAEPRLSVHSEVLCATVDRLEEIFEGTSMTSIGFKWRAYPDQPVDQVRTSKEIWQSEEFE